MTNATATAPKRARGRPKKTEQERDEGNRRQALIAAAAQLFRRQGYDATSTREIAAQVGMQPGSPFYHFANKQELLVAVMAEGMRRAIEHQTVALGGVAPQATPREILKTLIRHHFDVLLGPDSDFIPVMLYEWRSLSDAQRSGISALRNAYEAAWLPVLRALHRQGELRAPVHLSRLLILGALNWTVQWYETPATVHGRPRAGRSAKRASLDTLAEVAMALFLGSPSEASKTLHPR